METPVPDWRCPYTVYTNAELWLSSGWRVEDRHGTLPAFAAPNAVEAFADKGKIHAQMRPPDRAEHLSQGDAPEFPGRLMALHQNAIIRLMARMVKASANICQTGPGTQSPWSEASRGPPRGLQTSLLRERGVIFPVLDSRMCMAWP